MSDFLLRTITKEGTVPLPVNEIKRSAGITVKRTRTSMGFRSISIYLDDQKLHIDSDTYKDNYEQVAYKIIDVLKEVVKNPCTLPEITDG